LELPLVSSVLLQLSELWSCLNQDVYAEQDFGITMENVLLVQADVRTAHQTALAINVLFQPPVTVMDHANVLMEPTSLLHPFVIAINAPTTLFHALV